MIDFSEFDTETDLKEVDLKDLCALSEKVLMHNYDPQKDKKPLSADELYDAVQLVMDAAAYYIGKHRRIELHNIGVFWERIYQPKTISSIEPGGEKVEIPTRKKIRFTPSPRFLEMAATGTTTPGVPYYQ